MTANGLLEADAITKSFNGTEILRQVSVVVEPGSVVAVVGHNGAGKTTLMRTVVGLVRPDSGEVRLAGVPLAELGSLGGLVGTSLDASRLPANWRVGDAIARAAELIGSGDPIGTLARVGLAGVARHRIRALSMGMRQRLAVAIALVGTPRLLMLDEPTNALDPAISHELRGWLRQHAHDGNGVLLSSHNLAEVEEVADRIVIVHKGRVVRNSPTTDLLATDSTVVRVEDPPILLDRLAKLGHPAQVLPNGALRVDGLAAIEVGRICAHLNLVVGELAGERRRLTDIYHSLTGADE